MKTKKIISALLVIFNLLTIFSMAGCAAENTNTSADTKLIELTIGNTVMTVNGEQRELDSAPVIVNERTLLPIRAVIEAMGGTVTWSDELQQATLNYNSDEIKLIIGDNTAYLNNTAQELDVSATIINDRTMLPIRFIAESFKFNVKWNEAEQKVTITNKADSEALKPTESGNAEKALVLYFSNTGNTKALAEKIHSTVGGDIEEIKPVVPYTNEDLDYNNSECRANVEHNTDAHPEIQPISSNIEEYDVILIGYPIWWGGCPPVVITFLASYDLSGKTVMPFCTSGSSGISGSLPKIRELAPKSTVTEGFRGTSATTNSQIQTWLDENSFTDNVAK